MVIFLKNGALYPKLTIWRILEFLGGLRKISPKDVRTTAKPWLERLDLMDHMEKKVRDLSKGMQQKLQLITTLLHEPRLLILDEPFSGLDPLNVDLFTDVFQDMKAKGVTLVFSSHNLDQVERLCDNLALLVNGKLALYGNLQQMMLDEGAHSFRVQFHNDPKIVADESWSVTQRGKIADVVVPDDVDVQEAAQKAMNWGSVSTIHVGKMSLQELYVRTVGEQI